MVVLLFLLTTNPILKPEEIKPGKAKHYEIKPEKTKPEEINQG